MGTLDKELNRAHRDRKAGFYNAIAFNPVDFTEPIYTFNVRLNQGGYTRWYADKESYEDLWAYCLNHGHKVTGIFESTI
jgi:hypothetical protein